MCKKGIADFHEGRSLMREGFAPAPPDFSIKP